MGQLNPTASPGFVTSPPQPGVNRNPAEVSLDQYGSKYNCECQSLNGNSMEYVNISIVIPVGVFSSFDNLIQLPRGWKRLIICSIGATTARNGDGYYIHLAPTGKQPATGLFNTTGNEAWIPIHSNLNTTSIVTEGTIIEFKNPVDRFYLSVAAQAANITFNITIARADDIQVLQYRVQADTTA